MSNPATSNGQEDLQPLTILRFFVAVWIVLSHYCGHWELPVNGFTDAILAFLHQGGTGVKIFFFLSGFILVLVYSKRETMRLKEFWIARFARLYPLYLVGLLIALPGLSTQIGEHVAHHGTTVGWLVAAAKGVLVLVLLQAWVPSAGLYWNGPSWSLSCEAAFYVVFPTLLRWIRATKTWILAALFLVTAVVEVARIGYWESSGSLLVNMSPLFRFPDFLTGMILGAFYVRGTRLQPLWAVPAIVATVLGSIHPEWPLPVHGLLIHMGCATLVYALAFSLKTRPTRLLSGLLILGQSSYAIYLIHQPLLLDIHLGPFRWFGVPPFGQALSFFATLGCSVALFLWVEDPARNWLRRKLSRR